MTFSRRQTLASSADGTILAATPLVSGGRNHAPPAERARGLGHQAWGRRSPEGGRGGGGGGPWDRAGANRRIPRDAGAQLGDPRAKLATTCSRGRLIISVPEQVVLLNPRSDSRLLPGNGPVQSPADPTGGRWAVSSSLMRMAALQEGLGRRDAAFPRGRGRGGPAHGTSCRDLPFQPHDRGCRPACSRTPATTAQQQGAL